MTSKPIFIVIPNHDTRVKLRHVLEGAGHFVISAGSSAEVFLALENMSVPAILFASSNVYMFDGTCFTTAFQAHEKYANIPVVQIKPPAEPLTQACHALEIPFTDVQLIDCLKHCL